MYMALCTPMESREGVGRLAPFEPLYGGVSIQGTWVFGVGWKLGTCSDPPWILWSWEVWLVLWVLAGMWTSEGPHDYTARILSYRALSLALGK